MVTIRDVARRAGVSVGTVSRVLSDNAAVTPGLRAAVQQAVAELGYRPNSLARGLRRHRTNMIALVLPDITNPYFSELAQRIEDAAHSYNHLVVLADTHGDLAREEQQILGLKAHLPAGFLVVPVDSQSRPSLTGSVRTIALDRPYGNHPFVAVDHYAGGELAARHLLALGHRRISYIAGPSGLTISARRREGFLDCCRRAIHAQEVAMAMPEILEAGFDYHAGEALAARLFMRRHDEFPTAIATASDQQAIGIMRGASGYGLSIPRDLSIIGFDDSPLAGLTTPRLTTIVQPVREIAESAVAALLNPEKPQDTVLLSPTIKLRETTIRL
mgnify:CR=1 FL=1